MVNSRSFELFKSISLLNFEFRRYLYSAGFLEFNTGVLHENFEGGNSRPFITKCNANKKVYSDDGLIHIGKSFLETFKYKEDDWNKALLDNCEFRDINELEIYDLRWNFNEHSNIFKNNNFLKKGTV